MIMLQVYGKNQLLEMHFLMDWKFIYENAGFQLHEIIDIIGVVLYHEKRYDVGVIIKKMNSTFLWHLSMWVSRKIQKLFSKNP